MLIGSRIEGGMKEKARIEPKPDARVRSDRVGSLQARGTVKR